MASAIVAAERARPDSSRTLVWSLLVAGAVANVIGIAGGAWDAAYHRRYVVDTFFSPPHLLIYGGMLGTLLVGLVILGMLLFEVRAQGDLGAALLRRPLLLLIVLANLGFLATGPFDSLWHSIFGRDLLTAWTVPHAILLLNLAATAVGVVGLALWLRAPEPAGGIAPPGTPAARRWAGVVLFAGLAMVITHLSSFVLEWEIGNTFGNPFFRFGWLYPPLAAFISTLCLAMVVGAFPDRWWLAPLAALVARLYQTGPAVLLTFFGYPGGDGWLLTLTAAAVVYGLVAWAGRGRPAWVRNAVFGAGYIGVLYLAWMIGALPTLTATDLLITAPLLPLLAVAGGALGARLFGSLQRLAGETIARIPLHND